jgi:peptide/nickel transport system ATP-binding protein
MTTPARASAVPRDEVLSVSDLTVSFAIEGGTVEAVRGASWSLREGEVLGIVGESGSGKSATALAIMGLLPTTARAGGSISFRGSELIGQSEKAMSDVRGSSVAMVFQDPLSSLNPVYSVGYQVAETLRAHNPGLGRHQAIDRAVELLDMVGIANARERIADYPHQFSGGMRQRVVIAMAMANDPAVIVADEPTTALDVTIQAQLLDVLRTAREQTGAATVLITHDLGVVAEEADRTAVMYAGKVVETGTVEDIFDHPRMPYTLGLLGSLPRLDVRTSDRLTPIPGTPPSREHAIVGCAFAARCPLAREICWLEEPPLVATGTPGHLAACHFWAELDGKQPADVFSATAATGQWIDRLTAARSARPDPQAGPPLLTVTELVKHYPVRSTGVVRRVIGDVHATCGVSFDLASGETLGLVGESGSGKSTVAKLLMSMERPTGGAIAMKGRPLNAGKSGRRSQSLDLQIVFQDPMNSLDPRMTGQNLVAEPLRVNGVSRRQSAAQALELLAAVGLSRAYADRYPHELSGGERQRIGIARALALSPTLLILDEPVSALDVSVQAGVINLLEDLQDALGLSYLFIAHDLSVIRHIAHRVAVMYMGRILEIGTNDEVTG